MTDFTTILNRGIRRHIDKNIRKRYFGKCDGCGKLVLLINYNYIDETKLYLCEFCYNDILNSENGEL